MPFFSSHTRTPRSAASLRAAFHAVATFDAIPPHNSRPPASFTEKLKNPIVPPFACAVLRSCAFKVRKGVRGVKRLALDDTFRLPPS
jgi:hypothetical protein